MSNQNQNEGTFVSVAFASFNGEKFLRQQLDSLLAQTYSNFEIVISDDGSTDGTHKILDEYQSKDNRIKWSLNPSPNGFIKNFERVIGSCKGEIIFLCDQDDIWYPEKIGTHINVYQETRVSWVYNKVVLVDENDKETGYLEDTLKDYYTKERKKLLYYTWGSCILGCATSYRAKDLHEVMPIGKYAPAHDSWIQLALYLKKSFFIDEYLQSYRIHENNTAGWNKEATKERENQAISDNMRYLKCLPQNKNLGIIKRMFFFCIYFAKRLRASLRHFMLV